MGASTAAAATIAIDTRRDGDAVDVRATAVLTADAATAWRVLTDYGRYPEFIPDMHTSRIVARHGSMATVEQTGHFAIWLFRLPVKVTFEIQETPPDKLESRAVAGTVRELTSHYSLSRVEAGTRLDYRGYIEPGIAWLSVIQRGAIERSVARQFSALVDEIERQGLPARSKSTTDQK